MCKVCVPNAARQARTLVVIVVVVGVVVVGVV
ncbi:unnamed protein product, partial [marine sediment metagenome]